MAEKLMVPKESFALAGKKGKPPRMYRTNTPVVASDPAVKKHPELFEELDMQVAKRGTTSHTASAAPGQKKPAPQNG